MDKVTQALLLLLFACSAASIVAGTGCIEQPRWGHAGAKLSLVEGYFRGPQRHQLDACLLPNTRGRTSVTGDFK